VHGVADVELAADLGEAPGASLDDAAAGHDILAEQAEFDDIGAEIDDRADRGLEAIEIALAGRGGEADMRDRQGRGHGVAPCRGDGVNSTEHAPERWRHRA